MSRLKKFNIILLIINAVLLSVFGIIYLRISSLSRDYSSDKAKEMWDNDKYKYSQISLYVSPSNGFDMMGIYSMRKSVEEKLKESSVLDAEDNPEGRLWIDCASGDSTLSIAGKMGSCDVAVTGTVGDYFIFHPEDIMYGSYYTSEDINLDRIILDKQCSWQLFGSMDTVGMPLEINNKVFYVAAVVESPDNEVDKTAYGTKPRVYMPYESLKQLNGSFVLTSYEVCLPNIVKDYAYGVMKDINTAPEDSSVLIDQTGRFGLLKLFTGFREIRESVMVTTNISYPWYENRTRSAEIIGKILAGPSIYLLIIPAISLVYGLFMLAKLAGRGGRAVKEHIDARYQKKISEEYYKKHSDEKP